MKRVRILSLIICFTLLIFSVPACGRNNGEQPVDTVPEQVLTDVSENSTSNVSQQPDAAVNVTDTNTQEDPEPDEDGANTPGEEDQTADASGDEEIADGDTSESDLGSVDVGGNDSAETQEVHVLSYSDDIDTMIASMTLREKICQMIIVTPAVLTGSTKVTSADNTMYLALQEYPVGGMILDKSNIVNAGQLSGMITTAQSYVTIPMIMTLDEEGGRVTRLMGTVGTTQIGPMYNYHELGPDVASFNAMTIGNDIKRFGFNMDLAPVADVWSNPANTVIGDRAYSTDFDEAATLVAAAVSGFHTSGVACCIKHFPGHGDTSADSHYGSVYVYKTLDEIRANEFKPFIAGINAGADAVMIGHLIVADQGNIPALFSYPLLTGVLRNELGFNGVIISDSLQMKAMTDYYGAGDIPVMAVAAGCDILLMPTDLEVTVSSLETAVQNGVISEERINQSVRRILLLKKRYI